MSDNDFQPDDSVRIVTGMFSGMKGRVIGIGEIIKRELTITESISAGASYCVIISVFGRDVPVVLDPDQIVRLGD
jgi:transcription antitermination factor NusG